MPIAFATDQSALDEQFEYNPEPIMDKRTYLEAMNSLLNESVNFVPIHKRKSRVIESLEEMNELFTLTHSKARSKSVIMDMLGNYGEGARYNPYDIVTIPVGKFGGLSDSPIEEMRQDAIGIIPNPNDIARPIVVKTSTKKNTAPFTTTVGIWIFNKIFTEPISDLVGYVNEPITKGVYGSINKKISHAILEDRMGISQIKNFIMDTQLIMSCASALCNSHSEQMFTMQEPLSKYKQELLNKPGVKQALENGDLVMMKKIENELIDYSVNKLLADDPAMDMYTSGSKVSLSNNFKNMYVMRSGVTGTDKKTKIVTTSYMDGMDPKDYSIIADGAVCGSFGRSCQTAGPGHIERQFLGATSHIKLLGPGSDCHTPYYINVTLNKKNANDWFYSYIIGDDGKLIEFLPSRESEFVGKTVKFRFSSLCKAPAGYICEACMGTLVRRLGLGHAAGLLSPIAMSALKNGQMKKFHVADIKLAELDLDDF